MGQAERPRSPTGLSTRDGPSSDAPPLAPSHRRKGSMPTQMVFGLAASAACVRLSRAGATTICSSRPNAAMRLLPMPANRAIGHQQLLDQGSSSGLLPHPTSAVLRFRLATEPAEYRLLDVGVLAHQAAAFDMPNTRTRPVRRACMRDFLSSCCARPTADNASIEASAARMMLQISACSCSGGTGITI
jgi:hypothetical protein